MHVGVHNQHRGPFTELNGPRGITTFTISDSVYAVVASYADDGVQVLDVSDPTNPTAVSAVTDNQDNGPRAFDELDGACDVAKTPTQTRSGEPILEFRGLRCWPVLSFQRR